MEIFETRMPVARRDLYLLQIQDEIKSRKSLLIKKTNVLNKKSELNEYLDTIKEDYNNYYNYILKEKQQQYNSMLLLKEYLDDLMKTDGLVNEQLIRAKHEQKDIMIEIDKIKVELDEIIKK